MPRNSPSTTAKTPTKAPHDSLGGVELPPLATPAREVPCPLVSQQLLRVAPGLGPRVDTDRDRQIDPKSRLRSSLTQNGDINHWDAEIAQAANEDAAPQEIRVWLERSPNRPRMLRFKLPAFLLEGDDRELCVRYLASSIYNVGVCEGVRSVVFFMAGSKDEEGQLAAAVREKLRRSFPRFSTYANWGETIDVHDSSHFDYYSEKQISQEILPTPNLAKGKCLVGIDVGGTSIKTVILSNNSVRESFAEDVNRSRGGQHLREQIMFQLDKAKHWVAGNPRIAKGIDAVGLTLPSPIKRLRNGRIRIVRLTSFERDWPRKCGSRSNFSKDYDALNRIVEDIQRKGIRHVSVLNDADAFGIGEVYHELVQGTDPKSLGTKVVLPIGTGPGYVKIVNGIVENITNQGGHMVIDVNEPVATDPGCETKGCYGGYVSASAIGLRAKQFGIDISGKADFVSTDLDHALGLFSDMASRIAALAVAVHKITGATEVILTGGVAGGNTGQRLVAETNIIIWARYPAFRDRVKVVLSRSLRQGETASFDGAIGAALYAVAEHESLLPRGARLWKTTFALPKTRVGKEIISEFFDTLRKESKKVTIITAKALAEFLSDKLYPWWTRAVRDSNVLHCDDFPTVDQLRECLRQRKQDVIVTIGAGSVTDWGKSVGRSLGCHVVAIPSALSSNAMFTEKAIFYRASGSKRWRVSEECGPVDEVIIDLRFLKELMDFSACGISSVRANRAGAGDIVSIYPALRDWELALGQHPPQERADPVIMRAAAEVFRMVEDGAEEVKDMTDLGMITLTEALAEASLLNMRFGSSRPKDGAEHLVADELDKLMAATQPRLHGEEVALASLIMGYFYSNTYDMRALALLRRLVARLGLPLEPKSVGITRDMIVRCLQQVAVRRDKYTYFDRYGAKIPPQKAEEIYDTVFGSKRGQIKDFGFDLCRYVNNSVVAMFTHIQEKVLPHLDERKTAELVHLLSKTQKRRGRVIINAAGRIGEVALFFQQKLRALGYAVDDLKEATPEFFVGKDDLILTLSGSGKTCSILDNLQMVCGSQTRNGTQPQLFSITASPRGPAWRIGGKHHRVLHIRGRSKFDTKPTATEGYIYLPLSSTYEYSTMLFLEGVIEALIGGAQKSRGGICAIVKKVITDTPADTMADLTSWLQRHETATKNFIRLLEEVKSERLPCRKPISERRIYFFGLGQNNYVVRLFARRMQNIGFEVYVPGPRDIISDARQRDIAIFVSNSGVRERMIRKIDVARKQRCTTVVITANSDAPLARRGRIVLPILPVPSPSHTAEIMGNDDVSREQRHLKRRFEIAAMFYLEGISVALMQSLHLTANDLQHVAREWE